MGQKTNNETKRFQSISPARYNCKPFQNPNSHSKTNLNLLSSCANENSFELQKTKEKKTKNKIQREKSVGNEIEKIAPFLSSFLDFMVFNNLSLCFCIVL